jgi:hypothetical protein
VKVVQALAPAQWKRINRFVAEGDIQRVLNFVESLTWFALDHTLEEPIEV